VEGKGWTNAEDLQLGDDIRNADGSTGEVERVTTEEAAQEMYNLTVDEAHTYYVGDGQWLVHNACPPIESAQDGIAIIKGYYPHEGDRLPHFSIEVQYGDDVFETHQVITAWDMSQTTIIQVSPPRTPDQIVEIFLPNARSAQEYQRSVLWNNLGKYDLNNTCVTHVCNVLRVGGAEGVPPAGSGIRDIAYLRKYLGFDSIFR